MANKIKKHTLENGLNVYFYKDNTKHSTYFSLVVKYGGLYSDFKTKGETYHTDDGIQHFLEHLLLETSQYGNLMTLFREKQIKCNGSTSETETNYYFNTVENLDFGIEKLIKGINEAVFNVEDVKKTKEPIYQEIKMRYDDKFRVLLKTSLKNSFNKIPFNTVLGTLKNIEDISYETAKFCYDTFYQPKNEFITVVGNFDEEHVLEVIKNSFNAIDREYNDFEIIKFDEKNEIVKDYEECKMSVSKTLAQISYKIPVSEFVGYDRIQLSEILSLYLNLNFGTSSPLYKNLINERIIYNNINLDVSFYFDFVFLNISSLTNDFDYFIKKIKEVCNSSLFNDEEMFELLKKNRKMNFISRLDDIRMLAIPFIRNLSQFNYDKLETIEDIDNITFEKYLDLISKLNFDNYTVVRIDDKK